MQTSKTIDIKLAKPTAVAVGYFDGVHIGHKAVINAAMEQHKHGLACCVFSFEITDASPMSKKDSALLQPFFLKAQVLSGMGVDFFVCPPFSAFMGMSPEEYAIDLLCNRLHARVVCCGSDYRFGKGAAGNPDMLRELLAPHGVEVTVVDAVLDEGLPVSSTRIRHCLLNGEMEEANRLLGRPFSIMQEVVHGQHLGSALGFPTANQAIPKNMICPRFGVYATKAIVDGKPYNCVTNVGTKPTVSDQTLPMAESCILGFDGDLYGKTITTQFFKFLRPETKFQSVALLKSAIEGDVRASRAFFAAQKGR